MHRTTELIHDISPPCAVPGGEPGIREGWAWSLPRGPACARHARALLAETLADLGVPRDPIADAKLMVSELATNAYQHAADYGPHELWLAVDGDAQPPAEIRCAVFDAYADARLPGYSWTSGDCGRGLSIVAQMSQGRWGLVHTLSRLGTPVPGKAVWFAVRTRAA
ncbi:ATP-binding protein [Actinomadura sp. NBRC 104425]|uniref:ATP-binding protein n=1 Tax=Actinomadura sp. NBRC 104425 TaxID=3032204 RepID=UPI002555F2ED|nr:ATP-binding protein [Actinomadura sp. NBRC 104425]